MRNSVIHRSKPWFAFGGAFLFCVLLGAGLSLAQPATAAADPAPVAQAGGYAGPDACAPCHAEIHEEWLVGRHALAFSSPIFQQNWEELGSRFSCLECHTTGWDPGLNYYAFEGVTCESCHGRFQSGHPMEPMPITPDADLCATCHKTTTDEWRASPHAEAEIQCQSCHDPHGQTPKAETVTDLCTNCHQDMGPTFAHGTHADAGLECSNCHMYTPPRQEDPIMGLIPTGHTFLVGSEACIGCHQDTVHTRDTILELTGEVRTIQDLDVEELRQELQTQTETIQDLETRSSVRLYLGLAQGAIVGLATGGVAAWVVSRRLVVVEVEGDEDE